MNKEKRVLTALDYSRTIEIHLTADVFKSTESECECISLFLGSSRSKVIFRVTRKALRDFYVTAENLALAEGWRPPHLLPMVAVGAITHKSALHLPMVISGQGCAMTFLRSDNRKSHGDEEK